MLSSRYQPSAMIGFFSLGDVLFYIANIYDYKTKEYLI